MQTEEFVGARGGVVGELEHGAEVLKVRFRPTREPGPQGPVVNDLDGGCDQRGDAIEVERSLHSHDRLRRCRGAGTRGAVGEEIGVPFVQPRDGVAQPVDGEDLGPRPSSLGVDLDQSDPLALVGADIERRAGKPARGHPQVEQRERIAEGRERLLPPCRISSAQQRAPCGERSLPVVGDAGRMVHDFAHVGGQGGKRVGVPRDDCSVQPSRVRGGGVRSHASLLDTSGRRRWLGRQLVEAGERPGLALGLELLPARQEAVGSEDPEHEGVPLEGAAADA